MNEENTIIEATSFQRAEVDTRKRWIQVRPSTLIIGFVFLLLAAAAIFMFAAKAVRVTVTPAPETFRITSGLSYKLADRYLMLPGEYTFIAGKQGYHLLNGSFEVNGDPDQDFQFELVELPGIVDMSTNPPVEAEVFIDQVLVGTTPLTLDEVTPGLHDISIHSSRFLDFDTELEVAGRRQTTSFTADLSPAWADVSIETEPAAATVWVDGESLGETPTRVEILEGYRTVEVKKAGFKTYTTNIEVNAGIALALDPIILEKADGKVSIRSTPLGANITINGRYMGQTPTALTLAPGKAYNVMLSKAGFEPLNRQITVHPEEDISLSENLQPILGVVRLSVEPAIGELFVDGKSLGDPNQRLSLTAKRHELVVRAEGYADYRTVLTPQPGSTQQLVVRLQTEAEAAAAAIPTMITATTGLELKLIIPDKLTMGASRREPGRRSNEIEKDVVLTKAFYLGTTEVTNEQFKAFDPSHSSGILGRALLDDSDRPVVNLSWESAARFCNWLSEQEGLDPAYQLVAGKWQPVFPLTNGYRLPTEAEWAWAARYANSPNPTRVPWGDTMPPVEVTANYADLSAANMVPYYIATYQDNFRGPAPTATYPANQFGIYDLAGNVAEWVHDFYSVQIPTEQLVDPEGPNHGDYHVIRGSSYKHGRFSELRWTYRDYGDVGRADVGFRVARYLE